MYVPAPTAQPLPPRAAMDVPFSRAPMMIYWELTRACDLACRHCRAEAVPWRDPRELSTDEGYRLLEALAGFGTPGPHLVFTGGDPLKRPDVYDLAARAVALGLQPAITPAGTPLLTRKAMGRLFETGVRTLALSLDGSTPQRHDHIRQVPGSFARTVEAARWARQEGLALQINSLVCAETADDLPALYELSRDLDADRWSTFFLVRMGRGAELSQITPEECERLLEWMYDLAQRSPRPAVKTTEAHHFRRVALQAQKRAAQAAQAAGTAPAHHAPPAALHGHPGGTARAAAANAAGGATNGAAGGPQAIRRGFGIRDGAGIMFVSHTGEVFPSGFLPLSAGNVRQQDPVQLYRESPLFVRLRDTTTFKGKCGVCEYRAVCGGARSRAWAATGDAFQADPLCVYQPQRGATIPAVA